MIEKDISKTAEKALYRHPEVVAQLRYEHDAQIVKLRHPYSQPAVQLRAAKAVCRDRGCSYTTLWRMEQRGWIKFVNVAGSCYVDMESLARFDERARNREFAKPPTGAALKSAQAKAAKEGAV